MVDMQRLGPQSLAQVVDIALAKHQVTTGRALSRKATELGMPLSYTVINEIRRNSYMHPLQPSQRVTLSKLSGIPLRVVDELAGAPTLAPFHLPDRAAALSGEQRKAILSVVNAFINSNEALASAQDELELIEAEDEAAGISFPNEGQP